nr:hypothetical protein AXF42_Ash015272 [Ipomoea trifida]GLL33819.1 hypothetical protein AXF42_Ash015272 [Ipomoea trifida]
MAMEVLNRESSPKCPTIITEITCKKYCDKVTATIGPAKYPNLFTTTQIAAHRHQNSLPLSSSIATPPPCLFLISSSLLNKNSLLKLLDFHKELVGIILLFSGMNQIFT